FCDRPEMGKFLKVVVYIHFTYTLQEERYIELFVAHRYIKTIIDAWNRHADPGTVVIINDTVFIQIFVTYSAQSFSVLLYSIIQLLFGTEKTICNIAKV